MAFTTHTHTAGFHIADRVRHLIDGIKLRLARHNAYVELRYELNALDDRSLNDLGISRSDIDAIAYENAYGA